MGHGINITENESQVSAEMTLVKSNQAAQHGSSQKRVAIRQHSFDICGRNCSRQTFPPINHLGAVTGTSQQLEEQRTFLQISLTGTEIGQVSLSETDYESMK